MHSKIISPAYERSFSALLPAERERAEALLLLLEFFPETELEGYSSIASKNLYPKDEEVKELASVYDKLSKVSLLEHTFNVKEELDKLFERHNEELGLYVRIGDKKVELNSSLDYFKLLVAVLYHDVAKSPKVLSFLGYSYEEYRKTDHALWGGEYLKRVRKEVEDFYGIKVPEDDFQEIYIAVVMHHNLLPKNKIGLVLKELDKRAREKELSSLGAQLQVKETKTYLEEEDLQKIVLPEDALSAFLRLIKQRPDRRKRSGDKVTFYWFYHPPYLFVNSLLVRNLLLEAIRKEGVGLSPELVRLLLPPDNAFVVAQVLVKELFRLGIVKDVKPPFGGRHYLITTRDGSEQLFFGIPLIAWKLKGIELMRPSEQVISVRPLKPSEVKEIKALKS